MDVSELKKRTELGKRKLTKQKAEEEKREAERKQKELEAKEASYQKGLASDIEFYEKEIEQAADAGKNEYYIDIGTNRHDQPIKQRYSKDIAEAFASLNPTIYSKNDKDIDNYDMGTYIEYVRYYVKLTW